MLNSLRSSGATAALALALLASPARAQDAPQPEASGVIDEIVDDAPKASPYVEQTGDPLIDRLNALEAKVQALEARNAELEQKAEFADGRLEKVEARAAKSVQHGVAPTFSDNTGSFTFKPRGTFQIDYAAYNERAGGYDYSNGTDIRRARFGFDGTAFKNFSWRIEAEYLKNTVNLLDAYVQYRISPKLSLTAGQHKAPYGLEANTSDANNTFLERSMASNAFGAVGAERRVGLSLAYATDRLNATVGLFGSSEATVRNASTPDEPYGVNARVTWTPVLDTGKVVHLGVSGYHVTNFDGNSIAVSDRPNARVDGGRIVSAAINGTNPGGGASPTGAKSANYVGAETLLVRGPFSLQGEYGRLSIDRFGAAPSVDFDGFNLFASWLVTGESRSIRNGSVSRIRPTKDFNPASGALGAIELAVRYDTLDLTDRGLSPLKREADTWTAALNWYLNANVRVAFNYVRFKGLNSPLVVDPATNGTTAKGDVVATRLQLDF